MKMNAAIEFQQVSGIGRRAFLKDISFSLEKGFIMGLTGKSGTGKSMLLKHIVDPSVKFSGKILIDGTEIQSSNRSYMNQIGFVSEDNIFQTYWTAQKNAKLYSKVYDSWNMELFEQYMNQFDVSVYRKIGFLSRGELIKFQMAVAIAHGSKLFLLDEATAGMDPVFRREFFQVVRKLMEDGEVSMIMATKLVEELEFKADYVGTLEDGRLVSYEPVL